MKTKLTYIFLFFISLIYAQTGWFEITPPTLTGNLHGEIFAWDTSHIGLMADNGHYFVSNDGGNTWTEQNLSITAEIYDLHFHNNLGISVGNHGTVVITTNEGNTWTSANTGSTEVLSSCFVTQDNHLWVVGANGTILFSDDNGVTWQNITSLTSENLYSVCFKDTQTGYISGANGTLFKTTDGGINWTIENINVPNDNNDIFSVICNNSNVYTLTGTTYSSSFNIGKYIYKYNSPNWELSSSPNYFFNKVAFVDNNTAIASNVDCINTGSCVLKIYKTNDAFQNSSVSLESLSNNSGYSSLCTINSNVYLLLSNNKLYKTIDGGTYTYLTATIKEINKYNFKIIYNPVNEYLKISYDASFEFENTYINIRNIEGKLVKKEKMKTNVLPINQLHKGIYFLQIYQNNNIIYLSKFIKN